MKKNKKKLLIGAVALILVAAVIAGVVLLAGSNRETVGVYPFMMVGMDGYWGDSQESHGPVSTDNIQTVYLSDTQTVTEVLVNQGDQVKKGDVLMSFDTTLSDLQLERKRLEVEKLKLQLEEAKKELQRIRGMKPMEIPEDGPSVTPPSSGVGTPIPGAYVFQKNVVPGHAGLTAETAFVCWLKSSTPVSHQLLNEMRIFLWDYYGKTPELCTHGNLDTTCNICHPPECVHNVVKAECPVCSPKICGHKNIKDHCRLCNPCVHEDPDCGICYPEICTHGNIGRFCEWCHPCVHGLEPSKCGVCRPALCEHNQIPGLCTECNAPPASGEGAGETGAAGGGTGASSQSLQPEGISASGGDYRIQFLSGTTNTPDKLDFYVVFKTTEGDTDLGMTSLWQGVHVTYEEGLFSQRFYPATMEDYTQPEMKEDVSVIPDVDMGSGFTAAQIAQMRIDQEKKIKELDFNIRLATAEHKVMQKELGDGKILAEIDGTITSILTEEEAKQQSQPMLKLSGGGGFYVTGSVSELEKEKLTIGQEVTINDWSTGGMYTGTVHSIGDFPSNDGYWNGAGNPNATYYPFTVFVGEEASLQAGSYVNIQYSTSEASGGIYLDRAFLRTEAGRSYVFVLSPQNTLEKRYVATGKTLWGSYVEILSGLTVEDYIAFPYGKDVKEGAPAEEKDISTLYSY